jgi:ubiquinone/menaquinone biosynthesis C-methylase UbiE
MLTQEQIKNAWDDIASGYDEFVTPSHNGLAEKTLRLAGLHFGMHFLDVAAGTGALSLPAARLGAHVVATDISPAMIQRLNARAREEGLSNLEGYVKDGHNLDLDDDSFDISASQYGVMLLQDLPQALGEMARVTRPGGRVLVTAFGPPTQVEFLKFFLGAMKAVIPGFAGLPMDPPPLPFQVSDPEKLRQEMASAGLKDIRIERVSEELAFQSGKHLWNWVTNSHPIGANMVADLTEKQAFAVQQVLDDMLKERADGSGPAILTNPGNIGIGTS